MRTNPEGKRNVAFGGLRENTHQLLEWLEGLADLEFKLHLVDTLEVWFRDRTVS